MTMGRKGKRKGVIRITVKLVNQCAEADSYRVLRKTLPYLHGPVPAKTALRVFRTPAAVRPHWRVAAPGFALFAFVEIICESSSFGKLIGDANDFLRILGSDSGSEVKCVTVSPSSIFLGVL